MTNFEIALIILAIVAAFAGYFYGKDVGAEEAEIGWMDEALWWRKNSYGLIEPGDRDHG